MYIGGGSPHHRCRYNQLIRPTQQLHGVKVTTAYGRTILETYALVFELFLAHMRSL
jgi:hypothetical protein